MQNVTSSFEKFYSTIGASQIAGILGKAPESYPDAYKYWQIYTKRIEPDEPNDFMIIGKSLEPAIAYKYMQLTNRQLIQVGDDVEVKLPEYPYLSAHIDAFDETDQAVVEFKAVFFAGSAWHKTSYKIPEHYYYQVQLQMLLAGVKKAYLIAFFISTVDFEIFPIDLDLAFATEIAQKANTWWVNHVIGDVEPIDSNTAGKYEYYRHKAHNIDKTISVSDPILDAVCDLYLHQKQKEDQAKGLKKKYLAQLSSIMGDNKCIMSDRYVCKWDARDCLTIKTRRPGCTTK